MMLQGTDSDLSIILREIVNMYPNIYNIIIFLLTMPVSTALACLRHLKTYLRIGTVLVVITGLALMSIHKDFEIDMGKLLKEFDATGITRGNI